LVRGNVVDRLLVVAVLFADQLFELRLALVGLGPRTLARVLGFLLLLVHRRGPPVPHTEGYGAQDPVTSFGAQPCCCSGDSPTPIHGVPNLPTTMPNAGEKKVSIKGCVALPPSPSAS